ncbi:MAG: HNH endonuclease [Pseudomonadota bacterium]
MSNPFVSEKRRTLTGRKRAEFFSSRNGHCESCGRKIRAGENWAIDHIEALVNQGTNDESNLQLLCQICHGAKTSEDVKKAATNRRKYTKNIVPKKHQKKSGFRGWRKFNGDPVWSQSR